VDSIVEQKQLLEAKIRQLIQDFEKNKQFFVSSIEVVKAVNNQGLKGMVDVRVGVKVQDYEDTEG
jgi:hypothetical protein